MTFRFGEQRFVDAAQWFWSLHHRRGLSLDVPTAFRDWLREEVVIGRRAVPERDPRATHWSGVSLFVPPRADVLERYSYLQLYQVTDLVALHQTIPIAAPPSGVVFHLTGSTVVAALPEGQSHTDPGEVASATIPSTDNR